MKRKRSVDCEHAAGKFGAVVHGLLDTQKKLSKTMTIDNVDDAVLLSRPNNQRVELPNMEDEWEADGPIKSDDVIPDVDEEELTRDKVKKASNQLMNQQEKKKKKPKRRAD